MNKEQKILDAMTPAGAIQVRSSKSVTGREDKEKTCDCRSV